MKLLFLLRGAHYKLRHKLIILDNLNIYSGIAILAIKCCLMVMFVAITNKLPTFSGLPREVCYSHISPIQMFLGGGSGPLL